MLWKRRGPQISRVREVFSNHVGGQAHRGALGANTDKYGDIDPLLRVTLAHFYPWPRLSSGTLGTFPKRLTTTFSVCSRQQFRGKRVRADFSGQSITTPVSQPICFAVHRCLTICRGERECRTCVADNEDFSCRSRITILPPTG
jgi:hypothetical protein